MLWYAQKLLILFNKYGKTASPLANVTQRRQYCTDLMTGSLLGFKLNFKHVSGRSMTTTIINLNQFYILELARSKCFPFANLNRSEVAQYTSTSWFHRVFANEIKKTATKNRRCFLTQHWEKTLLSTLQLHITCICQGNWMESHSR